MALEKIQTVALSDLVEIGSVSVLGAEVIGEDVKAFVKGTFGAPTDPVSAGYFGTSKGVFKMVYPFNEQATVVLGSVTLTDESTGQKVTYQAGDSWTVTKGTPVLWEVTTDAFIKHFLAAV
ncbi:cupin domain-containing protein [Leeia sp. TBRC 13508]|uniref:Cupin domain-containing protein n=1 Tax=Leeia speluncae TaxID=2884804 RepID=A0ABS8D811_9NEIS|nr:cupin domain-containing protein [Leeia speluncae]MCB6184344.1 cupin domain-containing protein [Leeia speluncae]